MSKNKNWFIESTVEAGEVIINDGGSAVDFRIEGDTDPNLLVTDGSADKVGIGTNAPATKLEVTSDSVGEVIAAVNHNVSSTMPAEIVMKKGRGSRSLPGTIVDGDELGQISFQGFDGSNYDELAHIKVASTSVSSDTSSMTFHSDKFVFDTGTFQIGASGNAVSSIATTVDTNSLDTELCTAKAAFTALAGGTITFNNTTGSVAYTNADVSGNVGKVYYLSSHSSDGTFAPSILEANASRVHVGGDVDSSYVFKVTGASAIVGATTITGATQVTGALTVGVDDTGHDVKLFGATAGTFLLWDESADSLLLGADTKGVTLKAFGATTNKVLHWDEANNKLNVHGSMELGHAQSDEILVKGKFQLKSTSDIYKFYSTTSNEDFIFEIYNESDIKSFWLEDTGETNIQSKLKFNAPLADSIKIGSLGIGLASATSIINYDVDSAGSKSLVVANGATNLVTFNSNNAITLENITTLQTTASTTAEFRTPVFKIKDVTASETAGVLEVAKLTTGSGNLTIDSAGGTVTVDDNLTVTGTLNATTVDFASTTSDTFMIDSDGLDLGFKTVAISDSSLPIAVNKWLHPIADVAGAIGSAGIATQYIHSDNSMTISTKDSADALILAPGYNHDSGTVSIGTSTSKQSNLTCYGNATVHGDFTVNGTLSGSFDIDNTTSADFQLDSAGNGPHFIVGSDNLIQTTTSDSSTLNAIHTTGILLDDVAGGSNILTLQSYNQEIQLTPGSNAAGERYVGITGSIDVAQGGATTYNRISGAGTKIGAIANSSFAGTSDLSTGDTVIYSDNGKIQIDASEDVTSITSSDLIFGATSLSAANPATNKEVKLYGNNTSAYTQWSQANNKLAVVGATQGVANFQVHTGKAIFGRSGIDSLDVDFFGAAGEIASVDSGDSFLKVSQGFRKVPEVKAATVTLTSQESGRPIAIKNKTADSTYTLPAVADGLNYKFMIVERTGSYDVNIVTPSQTNFFFGSVLHIDTDNSQAVVSSDNNSNNKLNMQLLEPGSMIEVACDGTNWYISGYAVSTETPVFSDV